MLKIDIRYYDKRQEEQFKKWLRYDQVASLMDNGLEVDELELLTYSVFDEQRNADGWRSYSEMRERVADRVGQFKDYFDLSHGTVVSKVNASDSYKPLTEKIGVATSLVVANRIFDLHEADWTKIPESKSMKTLDFWCASTGGEYVEVEAKGTVVDDVETKTGSVHQHKFSISEKKKEQRPTNPTGVFFGGIAAIPSNPEQMAVCWLVDPPAVVPDMDPMKYKLLARLYFYLNGLQVISQSTMAIALRNRIETLHTVENFRQLDGVPLVNARGRRFRIRGPFFRNKTVVGGKIVGRVFHLVGREFMYVGFDVEAYRVIARQRLDEISKYSSAMADGVATPRELIGWLDERDLGGQDPEELGATWDEKKKRFRLELKGSVRVGRSGRAVGILDASPKKRERLLKPQINPELDAQKPKILASSDRQGAQFALMPTPMKIKR